MGALSLMAAVFLPGMICMRTEPRDRLPVFMLVLGIAILAATLGITFAVSSTIRRDIQNVSGIIQDIAGTVEKLDQLCFLIYSCAFS